MSYILRGRTDVLRREGKDVLSHFASGLKRVDRTYFCAPALLTNTETLLSEGYAAPDLPGFYLYPKPVRSESAPGIYQFQCSFYGRDEKSAANAKIVRTTVSQSITIKGFYIDNSEIADITFEVAADVLSYYYALPTQQRVTTEIKPEGDWDILQFVDPTVTILNNDIYYSAADPDNATVSGIPRRKWISIGALKPTFELQDISESVFGEWKETIVSWGANLRQ